MSFFGFFKGRKEEVSTDIQRNGPYESGGYLDVRGEAPKWVDNDGEDITHGHAETPEPDETPKPGLDLRPISEIPDALLAMEITDQFEVGRIGFEGGKGYNRNVRLAFVNKETGGVWVFQDNDNYVKMQLGKCTAGREYAEKYRARDGKAHVQSTPEIVVPNGDEFLVHCGGFMGEGKDEILGYFQVNNLRLDELQALRHKKPELYEEIKYVMTSLYHRGRLFANGNAVSNRIKDESAATDFLEEHRSERHRLFRQLFGENSKNHGISQVNYVLTLRDILPLASLVYECQIESEQECPLSKYMEL
ncbi:MAG: hypothetical protein FWE31_04630 [Firmicutes bacterium]|nr:hypothetical protein [Bacillota bacterium]